MLWGIIGKMSIAFAITLLICWIIENAIDNIIQRYLTQIYNDISKIDDEILELEINDICEIKNDIQELDAKLRKMEADINSLKEAVSNSAQSVRFLEDGEE